MLLVVMVEVVLVLVPLTSLPKNIVLVETGMMWGFFHIILSAQHPSWHHYLVRIIQIRILVVLNLVVLTVMGVVKFL